MCGIAGIVETAGTRVSRERLERACIQMRHRGPDDQGCWIREGQVPISVGFAAVRLAVMDPTAAGHQPMLTPDGRFALVYNGEIYNHSTLRRELVSEGVSFKSDSDTETILQSLAHWGITALSRLEGMFALAFCDVSKGAVVLARDPVGIKPLFWAQHQGHVAFASEISTLRGLMDHSPSMDQTALVHYLRYGYIPHPRTIYEKVHNLPPGHNVHITMDGASEPIRFASLPIESAAVPSDDGLGAQRIHDAIAASVSAQRIADVPLGSFLSGGLDSSIVTYHLARCSTHRPQTFCVGFEENPRYDERRYAELLADQLGTDHHELVLSYDEAIDAMDWLMDHQGQPFGDSSLIPTSLISRVARSYVTVCLSGDGGDELFGGYWRYLGHESLDTYRRWPAWIRKNILEPCLRRASTSKSGAIANRVRQMGKLLRADVSDPMMRHSAWSRILSPEAERNVWRNGSPNPVGRDVVDADDFMIRAKALTQNLSPDDPLRSIFAFDVQHSLPADMLHKVDLASMAHSLEVRVPLLDLGVIREAFTLKTASKIKHGMRKRILVQAYRGRLPDEILDRPKMGFELPVGEFLRGRLRERFLDCVNQSTIESLGILDYEAVCQIYDDHCQRRGEHADFLYSMMVLCRWMSRQ